jgi:nicotinamidase-related amidase
MDEYTRPEYDKAALIIVDVQNDFSLKGAVCEIEGTLDVVPKIAGLLEAFRKRGKPIIHVVRLYKEDGSNVDICRKKRVEGGLRAAVPGSEGAEIVEELKPNKKMLDSGLLLHGDFQELAGNEYAMYKSRWGAFYKTSLEDFLRRKGVTTLVFTGCNFPNCPRTSIFEASERDFRIVVVEDAISKMGYRDAEELQAIGCEPVKTEEALRKVRQV